MCGSLSPVTGGAYDARMSEQDPATNGQAHANSSPQTAEVNAEEPSVFERLLAIGAILLGVGVIIMGLDMATGGRLLGFTTQQEE